MPFDRLSRNSFFNSQKQWVTKPRNDSLHRNTLPNSNANLFLANAFRPAGEYFTQGERFHHQG